MKRHEKWLLELTAIPTAAGCEHRVIEWVQCWATQRKEIVFQQDAFGNILLTQKKTSTKKPIYITAHLDHPAFVVKKQIDETHLLLEFRGGVNDPYFVGAEVEVFDDEDNTYAGVITSLKASTKPFKQVIVELKKSVAGMLMEGDVARWKLKPPYIKKGLLHAPACDDIAGVAAAISALDLMKNKRGLGHVGVLLTRAEEIGFVGALAAAKHRTIPRSSRLLCLETSRSFPESPIGGGPILRVGDKTSVFGPELTNAVSTIMQQQTAIRWQRKLMPGGTCESTAFCAYGYLSTCLCLALGNYHNMKDIDGVNQKNRPARIGSEIISISDYHGLIKMLHLVCSRLDRKATNVLLNHLEKRLQLHRHLISR